MKTQVLSYCAGEQGPRSVLIMDNASSHHNEDLVVMWYEADVLLVYLLPYSADFNPIETSFSILKHWICRHSVYPAVFIIDCSIFILYSRQFLGGLVSSSLHKNSAMAERIKDQALASSAEQAGSDGRDSGSDTTVLLRPFTCFMISRSETHINRNQDGYLNRAMVKKGSMMTCRCR